MIQKKAIDLIEKQEWLEEAAHIIQPAITKTFKAGGESGKCIKNFLHGTWLGHPLHPALTDVPIGAWTAAAVLDGLELCGVKKYSPGADVAIGVGLVGAVGAAVTGLTDWTGTDTESRKVGLMHGLLNLGATALYATSYYMRKQKGCRKTAISLSILGYGVATAAAYLGGHLVFGKQIGVDHTATAAEYPKDFVAVMAEVDLHDNSMKCLHAGEIPVLLAKQNGQIYALANTCSHLGGPLNEGELLDDCAVKCPWHGSVFSLKDGSVISGPATESEPKFDVRVNDGQIEIKLRKT